ncbi:MAG: mechanosensitive ion channel family protein [Gemmatimonadales bacterium]
MILYRHAIAVRLARRLGLLPVLPILLLFPVALGAQEPEVERGLSDTVGEVVDSLPADTVAVDTTEVRIEQAVADLERLDLLVDSIVALDNRTRTASRDERQLANVLANQMIDEAQAIEDDLLRLIPRLEAAGQPVDSIKEALGVFLYRVAGLYEEAIERHVDAVDDLRDLREETVPDSLDALELRIVEEKATLDTLIVGQMRTLTGADSLGVDTAEQWEVVDRHLKNWAESQVGRLQIALVTRNRLDSQIRDAEKAGTDPSEITSLNAQRRAADRRVQGIVVTLTSTADMLEQRGYPTAAYRQIIIRTTGDVTADILNPEVFLGLAKDVGEGVWSWTRENGPNILVRLLIIIGFIILFRIAFRVLWWFLRLIRVVRFSALMTDLVGRLIRPFATIVGLVTGLWLVGANPTTVLAGLGVAGVIVGLALQDSMSNLAAGLFILASRPFDVEDVVEAGGVIGTVEQMGLANTTILTFDRRRLFVPNRMIWANVIENRSSEPIRRVEVTAKISYQEDLDRSLQVLRDLVDVNEMVLDDPEPAIFVKNLADSWIEIAVWPWVKREDWLNMLRGLPRLIKLRFEEEGIAVPFPRTELVARRESGEGAARASAKAAPRKEADTSPPPVAPPGSEPAAAHEAEDLQSDGSDDDGGDGDDGDGDGDGGR